MEIQELDKEILNTEADQKKKQKELNLIFGVLLTASIVSSFVSTALATALPGIMTEFNISATTGQWLTSGFSLTMGVMIPLTAFLIRRVPTRKLFLTAVGLFTVGLVSASMASSFPVLMIARMLQATGNGISMSLTQVVILTIMPPEKRGSYMGIYGLAVGAAPVIAPTISGIIIDLLNWHAIFIIMAVIAIVDWILAYKIIGNVLDNEKRKFDFISMILCVLGFSGVLLGAGNIGIYPFTSPHVGISIIVGIISIVIFAIRQFKVKEPLLELRVFRKREFTIAVILSMVLYIVMMGGSIILPLYVQNMRGMTATQSGLITMPGSLAMAIISPFAGRIYDKFGIRKLAITGFGLLTISCLGVSFLHSHTSVLLIILMFIIRLIAIGCVIMPFATWGMSVLSDKNTPSGTAILTSLRTVAGAVSSAVFVTIMTVVTKNTTEYKGVEAHIHGVNVAFMLITLISFMAFIFIIFFVDKKKKLLTKNI